MRWLTALIIGVATVNVQTVLWGGEHVVMNLTRTGADLEFDCATGTITEPVPEADGSFSLKGTFTPQRSGPSRDSAARTVAATYSGTIEHDIMTLHLALAGQEREAGRYTLSRDQAGVLRKCR